jgi:D-3-phosphoglycerate dehydrogenase
MQSLLFLQSLGVEHRTIKESITEAGLQLMPSWEDWRSVENPADVFGIVTVQAAVNDGILRRFPNLRVIAVAFTGYDFLDLDACRRRGIAVYNVPAYSTDSVAELTVALTICLLRDVPGSDRMVRSGGWKVEQWGAELSGKVVGIIGTGAIGLRVAELFAAFNCRVIGWSRTQREEFTGVGGAYVPLEQVVAEADVVSIHLALTRETGGLIGVRELGLMKRGACLINTARGRVVEKAALVEALRENRIRAALDVFDQEPISPDDPLVQVGNTLLTPHIAFKTNEALQRRAKITIQNIRAFVDGRDENRIA